MYIRKLQLLPLFVLLSIIISLNLYAEDRVAPTFNTTFSINNNHIDSRLIYIKKPKSGYFHDFKMYHRGDRSKPLGHTREKKYLTESIITWSFSVASLNDGNYDIVFEVSDNIGILTKIVKEFTVTHNHKISVLGLDGKAVSGSFFLDASNPDGSLSSKVKTISLEKNGSTVAIWAKGEGQVNLSYALWEDRFGKPITKWSQIATETSFVPYRLVAKLYDGAKATSNVFRLKAQNSLSADFSASDQSGNPFPLTKPNINAKLTASNTGSLSYRWMIGGEYFIGGGVARTLGTTKSITTLLGVKGKPWTERGVVITLKVENSQGQISYKQKVLAVDEPYQSGDPTNQSIPELNGVALLNGNYYYSVSDLFVAGRGVSFALARAYNSKLADNGKSGWAFNIEQSIQYAGDGTKTRTLNILRGDGSKQRYYKDNNRQWYPFSRTFDLLKQNQNGSFSLYSNDSIIHTFDKPVGDGGSGKLLSISDRQDNQLTFHYNSNNVLTSITDASNRAYRFTYDTTGKYLLNVTDFSGRKVHYKWSGGKLTEFTDVRKNKTLYTYTSAKQLRKITDPEKNTVANIEYSAEKVKKYTNADGDATQYTYSSTYTAVKYADNTSEKYYFDKRGRLTQTVDSRGNASKTAFRNPNDNQKTAEVILPIKSQTPLGISNNYSTNTSYYNKGRGNTKSSKNAYNQVTNYQWETDKPIDLDIRTNLNMLTKLTPAGLSASTSYDMKYSATGKTIEIKNPLHKKTSITYYGNGLVYQVQQPSGDRTKFKYDVNGYKTEISYSDNNKIIKTYDTLGRVIKEKDKRHNTSQFSYDADGNLLTATDPLGNIIRNAYDKNGNVVKTTDAKGNVTRYTYTPSNRLSTTSVTVNGISYTESNDYDTLGRLIKTTNRNNHASTTRYDAAGNILSETDALLRSTVYTYDKNNNVSRITDEEGKSTRYTYDKLDRLLRTTDDKDNYQENTYDARDNIIKKRDKNGKITRYTYDAADQLSKTKDANNRTTSITYDSNGNRKTITDPKTNTTTYYYDEMNRLYSISDPNGNEWEFEFDANGNQTAKITPNGEAVRKEFDVLNRVKKVKEYNANGSLKRQISYTYDANSNRASMTDNNGTTRYTYDALDRLTSVTDIFGKTIAYTYDGIGNIKSLKYPHNKTVHYAYDKKEQLSKVTDWLNKTTRYTRNKKGQIIQVQLGNGTIVEKSYDTVGRLIHLKNKKSNHSVISNYQLTLDKLGNITQAKTTLPLQPHLISGTSNMSYDKANRLLNVGNIKITHDSNGRLMEHHLNGQNIVYSFNEQDLITSIKKGSTITDRYRYDGENVRISHTHNGKETRFVVDKNSGLSRVLAETNSSGHILRSYIYGEGLIAQIDAANNSHYYHYNPTGHTLALTDKNQKISDKYAYTPYGEITAQGTTINPFRYVGKYGVMDDDNGLNYMRARFYKPEIKRFLSLDQLMGDVVTPQSLNRYAYAQGNPIMGVDPSGLSTIQTYYLNSTDNLMSSFLEKRIYNEALRCSNGSKKACVLLGLGSLTDSAWRAANLLLFFSPTGLAKKGLKNQVKLEIRENISKKIISKNLNKLELKARKKVLGKKDGKRSYSVKEKKKYSKKDSDGNYRCVYCFKKLKFADISGDHSIPYKSPYWGRTNEKNYRISCGSCNSSKGGTHPKNLGPIWYANRINKNLQEILK